MTTREEAAVFDTLNAFYAGHINVSEAQTQIVAAFTPTPRAAVTEGAFGPKVTVTRSCELCKACVAKHYAVQGDSGSIVKCAHPSFASPKVIGDTTWLTPSWCPALAPDAGTRNALAEDVLRCIPADWKPERGREYGKLGPILAEFIDDLREGRYPEPDAGTTGEDLDAEADRIRDALILRLGLDSNECDADSSDPVDCIVSGVEADRARMVADMERWSNVRDVASKLLALEPVRGFAARDKRRSLKVALFKAAIDAARLAARTEG